MKTTNKMSLRVWTSLDDDFDHEQLADNWAKLDAHDHTNGRGVQIPTEGIADEAITEALLEKEVAARLFLETESYSEPAELTEGKPETTSGRTIVQATVTVPAEATEIEIKVAGKELTKLFVTPANISKFPINFYVTKGAAWEWKALKGAGVKFVYKAIEL